LGANCDGHNYVDLKARAYSSYCPSTGGYVYSSYTYYYDYVDQQYLELEITPKTCTDYCVEDEYWVEFTLRNCHEDYWDGDVTINVTGAGHIVLSPGQAQPKVYTIHLEGGTSYTQTNAWHVRCDNPGDVTINVSALGIVALENLTLCDHETEIVHQWNPADLEVTVYAPDCAQYCELFTVTADVKNTGGAGAAPATGVEATINYPSSVTLISGDNPQSLGDADGEIKAGDTETATWTFHCNGSADPTFTVTASGTDPVCGGTVSDQGSDSTEQVKLDVEIVEPDPCVTYVVCDTFCVTAEITDNDGDTCFSQPLKVTISFPNGKASLVSGETDAKPVTLVSDGDPQQVSWTVHCDEPGDTDIMVDVSGTAGNPEGCNCCTLFDKQDTITVHQVGPPDVTIEIISPDNLDTMVATSQEFAVTVAIRNNDEDYPVSISDLGLYWHPYGAAAFVEEPGPLRLEAGETKEVTWTLKCNEGGLLTIFAWVEATTPQASQAVKAHSFPLLLWQYPAAHLEVEIIDVDPDTTVNVCDEFTVSYKVKNTGEADATEVEAVLSVIPEGSVRPAEGYDSGYTQHIGTIPGDEETEVLEWPLHCKEACESTINITAEGYDEYGWHKKQECQSTGNFIVEAGCFGLEDWGNGHGIKYGILFGESSGLLGPFIIDTPVSGYVYGQDYMGNLVAMGAVITDLPPSHYEALLECLCPDPCCDLLGLLEYLNLQGVNKDAMIFVGHLDMEDSLILEECYQVQGGLFQIINGKIASAELTCDPETIMTTLGGTYCSTLAKEALRAIDEKFIEDASVTIKQLPSAGVDLGITKTVDNPNPDVEDTVTYTISVTNYGPGTATGVMVEDTLFDGVLTYVDSVATQGDYDDETGTWSVGNMVQGAMATLTIVAFVDSEEEYTNEATVWCDQADGNPLNDTDSATINASLAIELEPEWNFVSWPLIPDNPWIEPEGTGVLNELSPLTTNVSIVWGEYDYSTGQWVSYNPTGGKFLTEMPDGDGFWIYMNTSGLEINIVGQEQPDPPDPLRVYPVYGGAGGYWNVIGFKSTTAKSPEDYLAAIAGKYTIIYGFDEGAYFIVGTPEHPYLEPGHAYWIAVLEDGNIFP
jgi:uncharacterized repeat protein (TIGR01451 family)